VAYELQLPFALKELREHAEYGVIKARETYDAKSSQVEWLQHVKRHIFKAVAQGGVEEEAKAEERLAPEGERIREALETFREAKEWKYLLKGCGYEEAAALGSYLDAHRGELEKSLGSLGKKKVGLIEAHARKRRLCLVLSNPKARWISVTDPLWAELLRQYARARSLEAVRNPRADRRKGTRSVPEYRGGDWRQRLHRAKSVFRARGTTRAFGGVRGRKERASRVG
jgi:hypothetical protein